MKILSIDFDFFQNVTCEQLSLYPDGIDHSKGISEIVWGSVYSTNGEEIEKIDILNEEFSLTKEILRKQMPDVPVLVAYSHKSIYDFIKLHETKKPLEIINIDMHHDILNGNNEIDCGNWLSHVIDDREAAGCKTKLRWITNPVSIEAYGNKVFEDNEFRCITEKTIKDIRKDKFDAIFLCRSDTWTPPHLDKYFTELCNVIKTHFTNIRIQKGVEKPRKDYLSIAKEIFKAYKNFDKELLKSKK